ncbi:ribonuclease catalytic domain-containing protein [Brachymonas denitrificans]|uniref:ribonuclease catalytic domain-containing protein n=1 Tax=Brachymonas denitrificans TaxID=28220 RepID=UPI001BCFDDE0|nr:ribonuclease catalytic domain-containing protein [Brachymonas denitrificans]
MFAMFEDSGKFLAGRILSQADSSSQIELDSGKRVKVKHAHIVLSFDKPAPAELLAQAQALSQEVDVQLLWEFAPEEEFTFIDVARDYFQDPPSLVEQAATLLALFHAPHYFRRAGGVKGRFRKAPAEIVQQALAAIEKKARIQAQIDAWAAELVQGQCPEPIREQLYRILFKPDKNAPEYKAVVHASKEAQMAPLDLLQRAGAIHSPYEFHWQRFLFEHFPKGTGFPALQPALIDDSELPLAGVQAFSIDDSSTTEIDDALSVSGLGSGRVTLGIHIAAPGLAVQPGDAIDAVARQRMSTVYMPGYKITMLPHDVVQHYTLGAGQPRPALSFYATFDEATLELQGTESRIERVPVVDNLRLDQLEKVVTAEWLSAPADSPEPQAQLQTHRPALAFLWRLAQQLKARREIVRGKPETFTRPDFNFRLLRDESLKETPPDGSETVVIEMRQRGAPLDLMVSEAMILVNHHWGQMLANGGIPGIYRSQAALAPGVKVRMGTKALPHAGLGVPCYAWSTSPLRRYVDLLNQWQLIAAIRHGATAALAAPFKPKDAALFGIISGFDACYTGYNAYQASMERFWTLLHVQRHGITELDCSVIKDGLVRANTLPLVINVIGADGLPRNAQVRVRLGGVNLMALDVNGSVIARLDDDGQATLPSDESEDDTMELDAGPLHIAVDVNEPEADGTPGQTV